MMGRLNWWMPRWLGRVVPRVSIEGAEFFRARDGVGAVHGEALPAGASAGDGE